MDAEQMYQEMILDCYRNPKNKGVLEDAQIKFRDSNPSCGDIIEIHARVNSQSIKDIKFSGKGCVISMAAAEMLTENVKDKSFEEIKKINKEKVLELLGIPVSPMRLKCALLSLKILKFGVYNHLGERLEDKEFDNMGI